MNDLALCPLNVIKFDGHCGYFYQNSSEFLKDDGTSKADVYLELFFDYIFAGEFGESVDTVLRFMAVEVLPNLRIIRDSLGFTIRGPHYSVLAELGKYLNYR